MIEQTMEDRLDEFARINEYYLMGIHVGKLEAFIRSELDLALKSQQERLVGEIEKAKYNTVKIEKKGKLCEKESWGARTGFQMAIEEMLEIIKKTYGQNI
jgi:hypothetical protein